MKGKKIAYVATVYSHLSVFHAPFINKLIALGNEVHTYAAPDHCRVDLLQEAIECRDISFSRNPFSLKNLKALRSLTQWFKRENYDIIHVHTPNASVVCRIAARLAGCKTVIYTAHGFHFFTGAPWLNWLIYFPVEWLMSIWTDTLITINQEDYKRAQKFPVRKRAVYVPGVGVDIQLYRGLGEHKRRQLQHELGLHGREFVILSVAELNKNKNHEQLIYSVQEMTKQGIPVVCLIAGVGDRVSALNELVSQLNLDENIKLLGFRKDIPQLMQIADTVVLLSQREGLPKVLLEALAAGKPMVATKVRGSKDLVKSQVNGYVVSLHDVPGTVQALTALYRNDHQRSEMGRSSFEQADMYDIQEIMQKLEEIYEDKRNTSSTSTSSQINGEGMVL